MDKNRKLSQYGLIISMLVMLLGGLILIIISQEIENKFWSGVADDVASALFISGLIGILSEYFLKDKLVDLIFSKLKLKEVIDKTGIDEIVYDIGGIDYGYYMKKSISNIDIVHVYARTWTNSYIHEITERLKGSNCEVRVVLLSPDSPLVPGLAKLYNIESEDLRSRILEVTEIWKTANRKKDEGKRKKTQSVLRLFYHEGFPSNSFYRFDNKVILVQTKLTGEKSGKLPSFICNRTGKQEDLYNLYITEIEELINKSTEIDLNT